MKKFRLFKALSIFAIAAAGAVAVGVGTKAPKVEAAEAAAPSWTATIAGSFNDWTAQAMTWSEADQKFVFSGSFSKNDEFKFVVGSEWIGHYDDLWTYGYRIVSGNGGGSNFKFLLDGKYTIGFDANRSASVWFTNTSRIYIENSEVTNAHVYGGASGDKTSWPGVSLLTEEDAYYRNGVKSNIKYFVYDSSWDSTTVIFNNGGNGKQTNDLSIDPNAVYVWNGGSDGWTYVKGTNETNALDFIRYWRTLRTNGSICAYYNDATKKAALISKYDGLGSGAQDLVSDVSDYNDEYGNHTISTTMAYFKGLTANAGFSLLSDYLGFNENAGSAIAIIVICVVSVSALGGLLFIRKRKHI